MVRIRLCQLAAARQRLVHVDGRKIRIDAHRARRIDGRLSPAELPRTLHADGGRPEDDVASRHR